jgi:hypothetical protein
MSALCGSLPRAEDRDLLSAAFNQTRTFQLAGSIRDAWPLDPQHFGEQVLSDRQCVLVTAVTHQSSQRASRSVRLCAPLHAAEAIRTHAIFKEAVSSVDALFEMLRTAELRLALAINAVVREGLAKPDDA